MNRQMSCPTCDCAGARYVGKGPEGDTDLYYCQRCGTLTVGMRDGRIMPMVPHLVERCVKFRKTIGPDYMSQFESCREDWQKIGVAACLPSTNAGT